MLQAAFYILWAALALGAVLGFYHLRALSSPPWMLRAVHGATGALGFGVLAFALKGSAARGARYGVASFGVSAAVLAGLALTIGIVFLLLPAARRRGKSWILGAHATVAVAACILLLAYVSLG